MHGLGNDFVVIEARAAPVAMNEARARGRRILFEGAHDPGNCHRTSLVRLADTETHDLGTRLLG